MIDYLKRLKLLLKKHMDKIAHFGAFFILMFYFVISVDYFIENKIISIIIGFITFNILGLLFEKLDDKSDIYDIITNEISFIVCMITLYFLL